MNVVFMNHFPETNAFQFNKLSIEHLYLKGMKKEGTGKPTGIWDLLTSGFDVTFAKTNDKTAFAEWGTQIYYENNRKLYKL